jgi:NAD(P)-dependent dehydrogenase (short-subunit alcohol dehydrogenase family)
VSGSARPRAVVTGASIGIGRATALRLARAGFDIVLHYREHAREAEAVAREIRAMGGEARGLRADLSRPDEVERLASELAAEPAPLDALVHNAGDYPRVRLDDLAPAEVRRVLEVHLVAPLELTRRLRPRLARSGRASVVFVSSVLAFTGSRHGAHYAAANAAQRGLVRSLARELAPGIRVNAVAPGSIDTAILAGDSPEQRADRHRSIPLGRLGTADEVAEAVGFLVEPASRYVSGTTVHVNGGIAAG